MFAIVCDVTTGEAVCDVTTADLICDVTMCETIVETSQPGKHFTWQQYKWNDFGFKHQIIVLETDRWPPRRLVIVVGCIFRIKCMF